MRDETPKTNLPERTAQRRHNRHTRHGVTKQASSSAHASQFYSLISISMTLVTLVTPFLDGVWEYIISVTLSIIGRPASATIGAR